MCSTTLVPFVVMTMLEPLAITGMHKYFLVLFSLGFVSWAPSKQAINKVLDFFCCLFVCLFHLGAHSHIRGLGLDDALEARQVQM